MSLLTYWFTIKNNENNTKKICRKRNDTNEIYSSHGELVSSPADKRTSTQKSSAVLKKLQRNDARAGGKTGPCEDLKQKTRHT